MTRSLTVTWQDPIAAFDAGKNLSGLEYMKEMIAGRIAAPPIMSLMGFRLAQVGDGLAVFECEPGEQHYNPIGVVHGGLAMTLLDSAMGCCVHTRLPAKVGYTTLEAKVNLVRAITAIEVVSGILMLLFGFSEIMRSAGSDRRPPHDSA